MASKSTHLSDTTFAFLDIETTGGNSSHDRITEIGVRFWRAGEVVGDVARYNLRVQLRLRTWPWQGSVGYL